MDKGFIQQRSDVHWYVFKNKFLNVLGVIKILFKIFLSIDKQHENSPKMVESQRRRSLYMMTKLMGSLVMVQK